MMNKVNDFSLQSDLVDSLSKSIAKRLLVAIEENNKAVLLVSGGSTPKSLFKSLSNTKLPWEKVTISLCDERIVSLDHKDSNSNLLKEYLLKNYASNANFKPLYNGSIDLSEAIKYSNKLMESFETIDVLILGMGEDAHTASLFPNNEKLEEAYDLKNIDSTLLVSPKSAPYDRISLTLATILRAKNIYVHFEGDKKKDIFEKAIESKDIYRYPISSIFDQSHENIQVYTA